MHAADTIAAISTAAGPAGRMIVRASGGEAARIAAAVAGAVPDEGGRAVRTTFRFAGVAVPGWSAGDAVARSGAAGGWLRRLVAESTRFERLAHEPQFVLVGRPNAGKSTLLNALAGRERAVTSPVAGTTRDALTADVVLRRGVVRVTDVAGMESKDEGGRQKAEKN